MNGKIAVIIERINIALGGAERSVFELSSALSRLGFKADILAAKGQADTRNIHILCRDVPGRRVGYFAFAKILKKYLAENHYDVVHSVLPFEFADIYQPRGGSFAESILRNAASYQNKLIGFYKRATAFANLRRTILLRAERKLCKNPNGPLVAALSEYVARQFKQHYGVDGSRIVVIPNGVRINTQVCAADADRLRSQILTRLRLREADNPVFFLFVANNFRLKGLAALIKGMQLASARCVSRPAYLIVAGRGKSYKYRCLARRFNVHRRMIFLGAIRHVQDILSIVDIAVLPTFYDPSSRFILEALAAGRPVITTRFNGAVDLFVDNRHGKVINTPQDVAALADAIVYFTDTENIQKASDAIAADNIKERISISRVAEQLAAVYNSILKKREQR